MKKSAWIELLSPFLIAVFPLLSLANENVIFVKFHSVLRSLLISLAVVSVFYLLFYRLIKDKHKAAILSSTLIFLLLTYGNAYIVLLDRFGENFKHPYLLSLYAVIFILVSVFVVFKVKNAGDFNSAVFYGGLVIVIYLLGSLGYYQYQVYRSEAASAQIENPLSANPTGLEGAELPDIYLIVLDGHTGSDVLNKRYGYDNSEFISELERLGFWVADCAHSNYPNTNLSIPALFQMDYLQEVYKGLDNPVFPPLNTTPVFQILNNHSYTTVTFHNFVFDHFDIQNDITFAENDRIFGAINEFEKEAVDTSILRILVDMKDVFPESWAWPFDENMYLSHYRDTKYALDTLPTLPGMTDNLFVYAHLLVTHDPYVFMPDGSYNASKLLDGEQYKYAAEFIDTTLPGIVSQIIDKSDQPPVIVIMGDHGAPVKGTPIYERVSILFAIYLQGKNPNGFYHQITPVNIFRVIFNDLFDADYQLLDDKSYEIWNSADLGQLVPPIMTVCSP